MTSHHALSRKKKKVLLAHCLILRAPHPRQPNCTNRAIVDYDHIAGHGYIKVVDSWVAFIARQGCVCWGKGFDIR